MLVLLLLLVAVAVKLLFIFAYHSSDFEVHRNWLAITHSLPVSKWYFESTSQWTLDYPPLFAWFEWLLSQVAVLVDPKICVISTTAYASPKTVWFQRCSVLLTELGLYYSLWRICTVLSKSGVNIMKRRFALTLALLAFNYGLIVVDHIHFQYNGFLFGVLLLSASFLIDGCFVKAAACFTVLLNLKHLFLYVAPVYFIYILFNYCLAREHRSFPTFIGRLFKVGGAVITVILISFLPFLSETQLRQIYTRLFPFGRGLTHAYWAPNVWALYNGVERILYASNQHFRIWPNLNTPSASMTRGLVETVEHVVLPPIRPIHTAILVILSMIPPLIRCAAKSSAFGEMQAPTRYREFLAALTGAAWASFLFGWHVHEKAILVVLLPLNLLAMAVPKFRSVAFYTTTLGHYSLIPLIPTRAEMPAVVFMFLSYTTIHWLVLFRLNPMPGKTDLYRANRFLESLAITHLWGLIPLYVASFVLWPLLRLTNRLPFLPLMATSMYTAVGLCCAYVYFLQLIWRSDEPPVKAVERKTVEKQQVMEKKVEEKQPEKSVSKKSKKKKAKKQKSQ